MFETAKPYAWLFGDLYLTKTQEEALAIVFGRDRQEVLTSTGF